MLYLTPPSIVYSICAQNGYGQHRPCKFVLLTLVASRRVTDRYLSRGMNVEDARTPYRQLVKLSINYYIVGRIHIYHK